MNFVTSKAHPLANLKAIVALIGLVATALLGLYADNEVLTVIAVLSATVGTWLATNAEVLPDTSTIHAHGPDENDGFTEPDADEPLPF